EASPSPSIDPSRPTSSATASDSAEPPMPHETGRAPLPDETVAPEGAAPGSNVPGRSVPGVVAPETTVPDTVARPEPTVPDAVDRSVVPDQPPPIPMPMGETAIVTPGATVPAVPTPSAVPSTPMPSPSATPGTT